MTDALCRLRSEELSVALLPGVGARLHSVEVFGVSLLRTPPTIDHHRADPFFWGGYHMAPWCNRLDTGGSVHVFGQTVALSPNFPDGSAMHGQVHDQPWAICGDATFTTRGGAADGWPWCYDLTLHVTVHAARISLEYQLTNTSDEPMPAGVGFHPWFRHPALVRIPATHGFPVNANTPAVPQPMTGPLDLRAASLLPANLDASWTGLAEPEVEVVWPAERIAMTMSADTDDLVVVAAHPAQLATIAVEPQTHAPAGLRRLLRGEPHGLRLLAPGATLRFSVALTFRRWAPQEHR
jgi:aldose 1-epimerase